MLVAPGSTQPFACAHWLQKRVSRSFTFFGYSATVFTGGSPQLSPRKWIGRRVAGGSGSPGGRRLPRAAATGESSDGVGHHPRAASRALLQSERSTPSPWG